MMLVFRCKLAGNGAALKIYLSGCVSPGRDPPLSFLSLSPSPLSHRAAGRVEALTSVEGANAAIQSARDYDAEDEKQPQQRRWVDIMPSAFAS